ncbi:haloalkane dehalogenase [Agaribacter marinus]|uniref:Haloalkane dehalogenase n=1 Tax=Agaribacter marinus TaxID=1431249 RepID=A0AA37SXY5_9ALTE|nr:haloalkane dehalogenase [Agaribacter marinus]GLR70254.1 haloalkane dehalogenase [Agaribacter marinus]
MEYTHLKKIITAVIFGSLTLSVSIVNAQNSTLNTAYKLLLKEVAETAFTKDKFVNVKGVKMHYSEAGQGDPILFLHGNPTSSYLWRNITPMVEKQGRTIAVDLIGMGYSDKPDIDYSFADHASYLEAFVKALKLKNITIVAHDWGAALGWHYATIRPDNVKAIAFMEGVLPPLFPYASFEAMGKEMGNMFRAMKTPKQGEKMIIDQHMFVEGILPQMMSRNLGETAHNAYRKPYVDISSRKPLLAWPREVPIAGEPAQNVELMEEIHAYMAKTEKPVLLIYADPGVVTPPELVPHYENTIKHLETAYVGQGLHFIQEDQPHAIGRSLSDWLRRINE